MDDLIMSPDGRSMRRGRRTAERHSVERAAEIWEVGSEEEPALAVAVNVSTTGIGLQTRRLFHVDDRVMVDIKRGMEIQGDTFIYVRGTVARVTQLAPDRYFVGVQIDARERKPL